MSSNQGNGLCMLFDMLIHCNIHISSRFTALDGVSQPSYCMLLLLQLNALLRFIGQNLGSTKSNGKSYQILTVSYSAFLFLSWFWLLQYYQALRLSEKKLHQLRHCWKTKPIIKEYNITFVYTAPPELRHYIT